MHSFGLPTAHIRALGLESPFCLLIQFLDSTSRKQQMILKHLVCVPMWKVQMEFQAPDFNLVRLWQLQLPGERTSGWKGIPTFSMLYVCVCVCDFFNVKN